MAGIKTFLPGWACLFLFVLDCFGQENHVEDKRSRGAVWEAFGDLAYEEVSQADGSIGFRPYFSRRLTRLGGKTVSVTGYMVPIESVRDHRSFMLSVLPINQCMFCGRDGVPPMVQVILSDGQRVRFTENPVTVKGRVLLDPSDEAVCEIRLVEAEASAR